MPTYFTPLRRKLGVMTLVMACVFMAGWVRSFRNTDMLWDYTEYGMTAQISDKHGLVWLEIVDGDPEGRDYKRLLDKPFIQDKNGGLTLDIKKWEVKSSFFGFEISERHQNESSGKAWIAPYWSIVIPLMLLSAGLLMSKPRPKVATTPPIP